MVKGQFSILTIQFDLYIELEKTKIVLNKDKKIEDLISYVFLIGCKAPIYSLDIVCLLFEI
jgi:hypothetical protein